MRGFLVAMALLVVAALLVVLFTAEGGGRSNAPEPPGHTPPRAPGESADPGLLRPEPVEDPPDDAQSESVEGIVVTADGRPFTGAIDVLLVPAAGADPPDLSVRSPGALDGAFTVTRVPPGETLEIGPGEVRKGVVLRLERSTEVRVLVLDADGAPLTGIAVQLGDMKGTTDGDGAVEFRAAPGTHAVLVGTPPDAVLQFVRVERSGSQTFKITKR